MTDTADQIVHLHRRRRAAMKLQQKIDRQLESFVRVNATEWTFDADEKVRAKFNAEVKRIIKAARDGIGDADIVQIVSTFDSAREPADKMRDACEKEMTRLAMLLPVYPWIEQQHGAGALGLATIVAEAGPLHNYANPAKLWKRLMLAPYDGHAGSTWKRETWRPRKLTKEEWIANPFSGERYSLMHQIATWLVNTQWIGASKTDDGEGKPNGPFGEVYAARRKHTATTHPDWSKMHSRNDALRYTMKRFLRELWKVWRDESRQATPIEKPRILLPADSDAAIDQVTPSARMPRRQNLRQASIETKPAERLPADSDAARALLTPLATMPRRTNSRKANDFTKSSDDLPPAKRRRGHLRLGT